jgi:ribosomal protein S18 acetylase RimI-like enzyme
MTHVTKQSMAATKRLQGVVRHLRESDSGSLSAHWGRLDRNDLHERFNGSIAEDSLGAYLADLFSPGSIIAGYIEDGDIRGVGELRPTFQGMSYDAELAFSIETAWKRRGIGTRLMRVLIRDGGENGYTRIGFETNSHNVAMKALARKFGAQLRFGEGETSGTITIPRRQFQIVRPGHPWIDGLWTSTDQISGGMRQMILAGLRFTRG